MTNQKPSELFEGENSSLKKAFDEASARGHECSEDIYGECYTCGKNMLENQNNNQNKWENEFDKEITVDFFRGATSSKQLTGIKLFISNLLQSQKEENEMHLSCRIKEEIFNAIITSYPPDMENFSTMTEGQAYHIMQEVWKKLLSDNLINTKDE